MEKHTERAIRRAYALRSVTHGIPAPASIDQWETDLAEFRTSSGVHLVHNVEHGLEWKVHTVVDVARLVMWGTSPDGERFIALAASAADTFTGSGISQDELEVRSFMPPTSEQRRQFYAALTAALDI